MWSSSDTQQDVEASPFNGLLAEARSGIKPKVVLELAVAVPEIDEEEQKKAEKLKTIQNRIFGANFNAPAFSYQTSR